jgi:hypothetical protein
MGRWTKPRKIADKNFWYSEEFDYEGPACYELIIAGPRRGKAQIVYVGETGNEKTRISGYARHGSHLSEIIDLYLEKGWCLYYRSQALPSKESAINMQNRLLKTHSYPWNSNGV